jgi:hypothetical protein
MITQLTFTQPTIGAVSLGDEAEQFFAALIGLDDLTSLDATLLAVLRRDTRKVSIEKIILFAFFFKSLNTIKPLYAN